MLLWVSAFLSNIGRATAQTPGQLCHKCENLNYNINMFIISPNGNDVGPRPAMAPQKLGSVQGILRRANKCSLCSLIARALSEQRSITKRELDESALELAALRAVDASCEISWMVDGRVKVSREGRPAIFQPCTRRLCVTWPGSDYAEAHLVLVHPGNLWGPAPHFLGRLLTSLEGDKEKLIADWISMCDNHGELCRVSHSAQLDELRQESYFGVVDVQQHHMRLCPLPAGQPYAALSYTWGTQFVGRQHFKATTDNIAELMTEGGIDSIYDQLPLTIRDAIRLVQRLGYRYLWVDSLCILQGDEHVWELNARNMDVVYGNAALTICAADGDDANAGLVALSSAGSRYEHHARQIVESYMPDLRLMVSYPSETYIQCSRWNSRAWTFQERILSKRCLIFTAGRVYFQCRNSQMSEDVYEHPDASVWSMGLLHGPSIKFREANTKAVEVYKDTIQSYTSRDLGDEADVLAAFNGIGRDLAKHLGGEAIFGLPNTHFDWALLWEPTSAPKRRTKGSKLSFPSWSWVGWKDAPVEYRNSFVAEPERNLHEWLLKHTWITWYIRDGQGNLRLIWDRILHGASEHCLSTRWQGYSTYSVQAHLVDAYGRAAVDLEARGISSGSPEFKRTMPQHAFQVRMVEPGHRSTQPERIADDQRYLQFWTWSAYFHLEAEKVPLNQNEPNPGYRRKRFGILDGHHNLVGTIVLDEDMAVDACGLSIQPQEFIAISDADGIPSLPWNFVVPSEPGAAEWCAYNVLMLSYNEDTSGRVAKRNGLGRIFKHAFDTAVKLSDSSSGQREWKEIILG